MFLDFPLFEREGEADMQINHLRNFSEVARCGSINQAAQRVFASPQALSSSIAALEHELGYKLFVRHHRGVVLTEAGKQVYDDLQTILPMVIKWFNLGQEQDASGAGKVQIYVALSLCASFNRLLIQQGRECPELEVTVHEARSERIRSLIQNGKANLGVVSVEEDSREAWIADVQKRGWTAVKLMEDEFCAVLGKDYFPELGTALRKQDFGKMRYISSSDEHDSISKKIAPYFGERMQSRSESLSSNLCMVALNEGVVFLPRRVALCEPLYQSGMLRLLPIQDLRLKATHYMLCAQSDGASPAERFLMEQIGAFYNRADWE